MPYATTAAAGRCAPPHAATPVAGVPSHRWQSVSHSSSRTAANTPAPRPDETCTAFGVAVGRACMPPQGSKCHIRCIGCSSTVKLKRSTVMCAKVVRTTAAQPQSASCDAGTVCWLAACTCPGTWPWWRVAALLCFTKARGPTHTLSPQPSIPLITARARTKRGGLAITR